MAKDKKSFVAYTDWNKTFEKLSDDEAGKLAKMMFSYVNDENPDAPDRITELLFEPFKNQLKRDLKSYEKTLDEKSRKGRMGNLKRWNIDLYAKVTDELMELEEAEEIAKHRHSDKLIATATKPSQKIADTEFVDDIVIDNETDILLEKETKEEIKEFPNTHTEESISLEEDIITKPHADASKKVPPKKVSKIFTKENFYQRLIELGVEEKDATVWMEIRRQKRAVFTENAIELILSECEKHNFQFSEAIKSSVKYGWQGFEYEWYLNRQNPNILSNNFKNKSNGNGLNQATRR